MNAPVKHTPGPWHIEGNVSPMVYAPGHVGAIAELRSNLEFAAWRPEVRELRAANALLIAAAPTLFDVVKRAAEYLDQIPETAAGGDDGARVLAKYARATLHLATGGA